MRIFPLIENGAVNGAGVSASTPQYSDTEVGLIVILLPDIEYVNEVDIPPPVQVLLQSAWNTVPDEDPKVNELPSPLELVQSCGV